MAELTRLYAKRCDLTDFSDPELAPLVAEIDPAQSADRPHRKGCEFALAALFLRDVGRLDGTAEILDVAAGSEPILFWLANRARRVVGIDIYGRGGFADREAAPAFLTDPAACAPYAYPAHRLEVRDMDARTLDFPDASFDAVVSFSSIEHFGGPEDIARAAAEIGRVLRPGGHAFIVTELFLHLDPLDRAPVHLALRALSLGRRAGQATVRRRAIDGFTEAELRSRVIAASGLALMQPLDLSLSAAAAVNVHTVRGDTVTSSTGEPFPHFVVKANRSTWTSVCLPLVKRA